MAQIIEVNTLLSNKFEREEASKKAKSNASNKVITNFKRSGDLFQDIASIKEQQSKVLKQ
jgi:hypothetical protein